MNVSVDSLGACKRLVRVEVSADAVNAALDLATAQLQKHAQLPGFRPGKSPKHLVLQHFGPRIEEEVRKKLLSDSFSQASRDKELKVIRTLNVEEQSFGRGRPFAFTVTCETAPEFTLPVYKGLPAKREISTASDADVERALNVLREQHVKYNDVEDAVKDGSVVVVNYKGTTGGQPLTDIAPTARGLSAKENFWLIVQKDSFLPGFTEALVGAQKGDKRNVSVTFPADFVSKELSGRVADYAVEIVQVKEKLLPEVSDAFASEFGAENVEALRAGIRRDLQSELDIRQKRGVRDQLVGELLRQVEVALPESILADETRNIVYNIVNDNQKRGVDKETIESNKNEIFKNAETAAKERLKAGFVLQRIAEAEKLSVTSQEMVQRLDQIANAEEKGFDETVKLLQQRGAIPEIQHEVLMSKVIDFLELNAKIEESIVARP